jgi:RNA polymerase sigma-70 factor (ECF subfamily)
MLGRLVIDLFRERARFASVPLEDQVDPDQPEPDQQSRLHDLTRAMTDCLARLPLESRTALILQVVEGRTLEEIAEQMKVPPATAGTRVYRAKLEMRDCLKRKGYEGGEV